MDAEPVEFFAVPLARSLAVHTGFPIAKNRPVALATEQVGLFEADQLPADQPKLVAIAWIVTVETPLLRTGMLERLLFFVHAELTAFRIDVHLCMAFGTRENPLSKRRRWDEIFGNVQFSRFGGLWIDRIR